MKARTFWVLGLVTLIALAIGVVISCGGSGSGGGSGKSADDDSHADDDDNDDVSPDDDDNDDVSPDDDDNDDATGDTWTDPTSHLTWQVTPASNQMNWADAKTYCQNLALAGGGWRLPTISELRTLIRGCAGTQTGGSCGVTDGCLNSSCRNNPCDGCNGGAGPDNGNYGPAQLARDGDWYWSSSAVADLANLAWSVGFGLGYVGSDTTGYGDSARCVR